MKKGILFKKENNWFVRSKETKEGDDIFIKEYPLSQTSSYYQGFGLKEGKEVSFNVETESYVDIGLIHWAVIETPITKLEVVNRTSDKHPIGSILTYYGNVEIDMQDGGTCIKIFI